MIEKDMSTDTVPTRSNARLVSGMIVALLVVIVGGLYGFGTVWYDSAIRESVPNAAHPDRAQVERGEYLTRVGDCVACHTASGGEPFAGGLPLDTGFGVVVSSNITPDKATGIGGWTMRQFILAMRLGIGDHGKLLYPAMPYNTYAKLSDADLVSVKYYLDTLLPVSNRVDSNQMRFPFNIRPLMIGWNMLFLDSRPYVSDPGRSVEWNRGAYLVEGLGHCSTCHSPKNAFGGDRADYFLQGAVLQGWYAPRITGDAWKGVADWSTADVTQYLKTGANQHAIAAGPMAEAIANSTQYITDDDLNAIAVYLKSLGGKAVPLPAAVAADSATMMRGQRLYGSVCATCHGVTGEGVDGMGPSLRGNIAVNAGPPDNVLHMILAGGYSARTETHPKGFAMPSFNWKLNDSETADLATFIRNSWGNSAPAVGASDVSAARSVVSRQP